MKPQIAVHATPNDDAPILEFVDAQNFTPEEQEFAENLYGAYVNEDNKVVLTDIWQDELVTGVSIKPINFAKK